MPEFRRGPTEFAVSDDFRPDPGPFGTGGYYPPFNTYLEVIGVDPGTEHVYVGDSGAGFTEWDENMEQIGPVFGSEHQGPVNSIAFDSSGGPHDGTVYFRGPATNQIAVFSPPVVIPDIGDPAVAVGHTTASLSVDIGPAGPSPVTTCRIEWGFTDPGNSPYQFTTPCDQALPFTGDTTATAGFSGLTPETDYHYRVVAGNSTADNRSKDRVFHTVAVLGVQTDPATNLDRTSGDLNGSLNPDGMETKYFFEYGTTERYNNRTPERTISASSGQQSVPAEHIDGLQAGRTYHYHLVAKNELGKTKGPDRTFLVPANPTIAGVHASGVGDGFADLNARINPLGFDTTYYFEYGSTPSYGEQDRRGPPRLPGRPAARHGPHRRLRTRGHPLPGRRREQMGQNRHPELHLQLLPAGLPELPRPPADRRQLPPRLPCVRAGLAGGCRQRHPLPGRPDERRRRRLHLPALHEDARAERRGPRQLPVEVRLHRRAGRRYRASPCRTASWTATSPPGPPTAG